MPTDQSNGDKSSVRFFSPRKSSKSLVCVKLTTCAQTDNSLFELCKLISKSLGLSNSSKPQVTPGIIFKILLLGFYFAGSDAVGFCKGPETCPNSGSALTAGVAVSPRSFQQNWWSGTWHRSLWGTLDIGTVTFHTWPSKPMSTHNTNCIQSVSKCPWILVIWALSASSNSKSTQRLKADP